MANVKVNFSETKGRIRPLHGMNSGPAAKVFTYDMRPQFIEAGFPYARLHDVEYPYGSGEFVDVHCVFPNFDADENDPANYNFGLTDEYLKYIFEVGCEPLFRLGESIEHAPVKRYIYPPKDYLKWARICEHIIRHYTEGWADGFEYHIDYWEIWNEADAAEKKPINGQWLGTAEQFYEFYAVTATYLKSKFPHLKIGGCGFCRGVRPFIEGFMEYISTRDYKVPLDFFSWHRYFTDIDDKLLTEARATREMLNKYGYADAESVFDEWNYVNHDIYPKHEYFDLLKNHIGASFCAGVLCALQTETDVVVGTYFEADIVKEWCGIFEVEEMSLGQFKAHVRPLKPFYAFKMFNELYKLGEAVEITSDNQRYVKVAAAKNGEKNALLISNYDGEDELVEIDLSGVIDGDIEIRLTDETHTDEQIACYKADTSEMKITLSMKKNSFVYVGSKLA
ncbi:MAG: hypothetical protein E7641_04865 [Ruminococcaceae bacterium]|nr:hypothetical protein [Oscillospiraceae bacterium]